MSTTNGQFGTVHPIDITSTMQDAYLDYAMSVIVSRALPDVRDGLKPVHRRILYAMSHDLNMVHTGPHKKSARIVGEVLGKYHPHGDTAVYDAMVRMAQDFSLRYPLVDGQGNFGSIDGDNAAAMRYTEARLAEISSLILDDLEKDTVEWHDNFDNSLREPDVLPAALPNLLINGSSGIAVGMATNIPPHNLGEIVDGLTYMIDNYHNLDDVTVEDLLRFIKGPDFPTGGILYRFRQDKGQDEHDVVSQGYSVGRGRLILQAKAHFEEMSRNRKRIVITELPYQTNKTALIERIASLVRDGKIEGITDLRDESDRTGMRIVIELTRNVDPKDILADLFKYTPLQQTFGMQMLALVDGQPRMLSLKRMLHLFIQHREEVIRRRSEYDLERARQRAHILEGLLKALDILDEVIATIRRSQRVDTARTNLMHEFKFTQIQAQAILDMQLRRLAALERKKLQNEYDELLKRITYLEDLLAHPEKVLDLIRSDLLAIKEKYGDARRTQIVDSTKGTLTTTDLLPEQDVWVSLAANGDMKRSDIAPVTQSVAKTVAKSSQVALYNANTLDHLYLFSQDGRSTRVGIHEIPLDKGKHLSEFTDFTRRDSITTAIALPRLEADEAKGYLFFATELGVVKRVTMEDFLAAAPLDPLVINVDAKDRLGYCLRTTGDQELILVSSSGKSIRFQETEVRSMGLAAAGVGGMKLKKSERIVSADVVDADGELMTITETGFAKRSALSDYGIQGRNGGGIVTRINGNNFVHAFQGKDNFIARCTRHPALNQPGVAALWDNRDIVLKAGFNNQ
jgi:DNA gyrase subunit A